MGGIASILNFVWEFVAIGADIIKKTKIFINFIQLSDVGICTGIVIAILIVAVSYKRFFTSRTSSKDRRGTSAKAVVVGKDTEGHSKRVRATGVDIHRAISEPRRTAEAGGRSNGEDGHPSSNTESPRWVFETVAQKGGVSKSNLATAVFGDPSKLPKDQRMQFQTRAQDGGETESNQAVSIMSEKAFADATDASSSESSTQVVPCYKMDAVPRAQLKTLFTQYQFTTLDFTDKTAVQMKNILERQAKKDHSRYDAFVCFVLSHGQKGTLYGTDGEQVDLIDFINIMSSPNCEGLEGKPKLFFIEACRTEPVTDQDKDLAELLSGPTVVVEDFFIGYSTLPYDRSYRNNETGDIYTQTFIDVMNDIGNKY